MKYNIMMILAMYHDDTQVIDNGLFAYFLIGYQSRDIGAVHPPKEEPGRARERCGCDKDPGGIL